MGFPNHPDKYESNSVVTPAKSIEYEQSIAETEMTEPPEAIVLCYSQSLMDYFTETSDGQLYEQYFGELYVFDDTDPAVGVFGNFGIGAPATAMVMDDLIAGGVETFLSIGYAGCLVDSIEVGDVVVCEKALRDEGTSHHYIESEQYAFPSDSLTSTIERTLRDQDEPFHVGPSWTTDAVYQETTAEIERYADLGVLTVEMEAATVFAVASHRGVDAGALFVVSDNLSPSAWEPKFRQAKADLERLGDTAKRILTTYSE